MAALIWAAAGLLLIAGEAVGGEFVLLMLGGGALAAAGASALGAPIWLSAIVFALISFVLVGLVRPVLKRHLIRNPGLLTNADAIRGQTAVAVTGFGDSGGQVRIRGEVWSARPLVPGESFQAGEKLVVREIDGAIAVVERGGSDA